MKILVLATAATEGGALTVLNNLYNEVKNSHDNYKWVFTVSNVSLEDTSNIKILDYTIAKKSRLHRLYFDKFTVNKLIDKYDIDVVISLQNTLPINEKVIKILYSQQSLPFTDYKFKFSENKKFWIYQNIISKFIYKGIRR